MDRWFDGSLVRWFDGSMDQWFSGSLVRWIVGSMDRWFDGSLVRWFDGLVVQWFGEHVGDPEAYRIPPVILWNPLVQTQCDLACPYCHSSLRTWRWNDGTSPYWMPRSIFSVQERVLLVSCVYLCGNHQVITHDPNLLKSVREAGIRIPFILFHKSGMTEELHNFISSSIQAGLCIQEIESMLLNL